MKITATCTHCGRLLNNLQLATPSYRDTSLFGNFQISLGPEMMGRGRRWLWA